MESSRQDFLRICGIVAASGLITLGGRLYQLNETRKPVVDKVTVSIRGLHPALEGFTIVQLTDIHLKPYTQPTCTAGCGYG
jgi:predicted MPP superfamily phosphohydrolase